MEYNKKINRIIFLASIVIFALVSVAHFLYKWTNYNEFVGSFVATNESIFQHIKMVFYCVIIYYFATYFIFGNKYKINMKKWMFYPIITFVITTLTIISMYYVLLYGFSLESAIINICSLLVGLILSSLICIHIQKRIRVFNLSTNVSLIAIFVLAITLTYFHYNPMNVDFYYDNEHNTYQNVTE